MAIPSPPCLWGRYTAFNCWRSLPLHVCGAATLPSTVGDPFPSMSVGLLHCLQLLVIPSPPCLWGCYTAFNCWRSLPLHVCGAATLPSAVGDPFPSTSVMLLHCLQLLAIPSPPCLWCCYTAFNCWRSLPLHVCDAATWPSTVGDPFPSMSVVLLHCLQLLVIPSPPCLWCCYTAFYCW